MVISYNRHIYLFGNATKRFGLVFAAGASHIAVAKPRLRNTLVLRLWQLGVRFAVELLVRAGPVTAAVTLGFVGSITTIVFTVTNKRAADALGVVTLEQIASNTDLLSLFVCAICVGFIPTKTEKN
jgi:hypothetical protein